MKQTKHIWWTFSPWEADALRQYLEQLALEGWYPECIGTTGMKCRLGEPEKRRYVAVLAPKTSVLTGADSWDAGKFRETLRSRRMEVSVQRHKLADFLYYG